MGLYGRVYSQAGRANKSDVRRSETCLILTSAARAALVCSRCRTVLFFTSATIAHFTHCITPMPSRTILVTLTVLLAGHSTLSARETVKTFEEFQCCYTLPGDDWSWAVPRPGSDMICIARNRDGLALALTVLPVPAGVVIDGKFANNFDLRAAANKMKKRDGRITTFRGLTCYQFEGTLDAKNTMFRMVIANGYLYQLELAGDPNPIEKRPDFETIMNGFEFSSPPLPPSAAGSAGRFPPHLTNMGKIATYCLLGGLILGIVIQGARGKWW